MDKSYLYHITSLAEWNRAKLEGKYEPQKFQAEGFIHCSYKHQLMAVVNRFFKGKTNLVILAIDPDKLSCKIIEENLEGNRELYPHIYGKLPVDAVIKVINFSHD